MERRFEKGDEIGNGHFSHVYKVKDKCVADRVYALKLVKQPTQLSFREYEHASKLQENGLHPNLVHYLECLTPTSASPAVVAFLLEYVDGETLERRLSRPEIELPIHEAALWGYIRDLVSALTIIHDADMVHLDLKPENVFITSTNSLKVGDFGQMIHTGEYDPHESMEGDVRYMAPELLDQSLQRITYAADMFSLGVMIWELATGLEVPLGGCELWNVLRSGKIPDEQLLHLSTHLKSVITSLLNPNPFLRPSAAALLAMDVFRQLDTMDVSKNPQPPQGRSRSRGRRSSQPDNTQKKKITMTPTPYQPRAIPFAPQSLQSNHVSSRFDPPDLDSPSKRRKRSSSTESSDLEQSSEASSSRSNSLVSPVQDDMDVDEIGLFHPKNLLDEFNLGPRKS